MRRVEVGSLRSCPALPRPLFHESGAVVLQAGERLGPEEIRLLERHGIRTLYDLDSEPAARARPPVFRADPPAAVRAFCDERRLLQLERELDRCVPRQLPAGRLLERPVAQLRNGVLEAWLETAVAAEEPAGVRWRERIAQARPLPPRPASQRHDALRLRREQIAQLAELFAALGGEATLLFSSVLEIGRALCLRVIRDPDLMLALLGAGPVDDVAYDAERHEPLARRSWEVAVLSIAAAVQLDYGPPQVLEIGCAALLHAAAHVGEDEGANGRLPPADAQDPVRWRTALAALRRFDTLGAGVVTVALAQLGNGAESSPRHFARLVLTARRFVELLAETTARGGLPHDAVREAAALGARREIDPAVVRAIFTAVSLFPVGSWIRIEGRGEGRVVRVGGPDEARPLVWLPDEAGGGRHVELPESGELRWEPIAAPARWRDDPLAGF